MEPKKIDYNSPIEKTSTGLAKLILSRFDEVKEDLILDMAIRTPESDKVFAEKITDFTIGLVQAIAQTDLPADYASYPVEKLITALNGVKLMIDGNIRQTEDEFISRTYGIKNPETGKYRKELITVGELMLKLNEARDITGGKPEDFFN